MTAAGPPWPLLGAGSHEPEPPGAGKAGPDSARQAKPGPPWVTQGTSEPAKAGQPRAKLAGPEPAKGGPPWATQTSPEPAKNGPPWSRQANPERVTAGPPWDTQTSPEPAKAEPVKAQPVSAEPAKAQPVKPERVNSEPVSAEPAKAQPVKAQPVKAERVKAQPVKHERVSAERVKPEPVSAEPVQAEPGWAGPPQRGTTEAAAPWAGMRDLSARLTALTRLIQIGSRRTGGSGFSEELLRDAQELGERADERLRLSAGHTVVALAGGTGSGKSSLFNQLAGHDFSIVGVTRPVTREPHACVWGTAGSGPLLEWLGVPRRFRYGRGSALEDGEAAMHGLILLDLPDHDSVVAGDSSQVARLVGMADLMLWVVDPQKYADAAVHRKYLVPLAGHSEVIAVVLNQSDLLGADEAQDCVDDLRRLLDSEGLHEATLVVTSAVTGAGLDHLRKLLIDTVSERTATSARISADVDGIAEQFAPYAMPDAAGAGDPEARAEDPEARAEDPAGQDAEPADRMPARSEEQLVDAFSRAAGVSAVADALQSARELRAVDFVGWPVAWVAGRITGRDPVRRVRLGRLWAEVKSMSAGPSGAQQAEIDKALTELADEACLQLPVPWSQTTRSALRSQADQIPAALGTAMGESLPAESTIARWWRFAGALQGLLLGCVIVSLAWFATLMICGVFHAIGNVPRLLGDASLLPWPAIMIAAFLFLGWMTAAGCLNLVRSGAARERAQVHEAMRARFGVLARDMVLVPAEEELAEYRRFRDEFRVVAGL
jgi:GTP-binding protein EngB required for normal cell division